MGSLGTEIGWPSKPQERQSRVHNHHISLRERIKELQSRSHGRHPREDLAHDSQERTKAAAWAVFQHHGGGGVGHCHAQHRNPVRRYTRFKIEAQMRHEVAHRSVSETVASSWDAGSTLFDSFELDSLLKTLDQAAHRPAGIPQQDHEDDDAADNKAGALVVYSPKHWITHLQPHVYAQPHRQPRPHSSPQRHTTHLSHGHRSLHNQRGAAEDGHLDTVDEMRPLQAQGMDQGQHAVRYKLAGNMNQFDDLHKRDHDDDAAAEEEISMAFHTPNPFNVGRNGHRSFDSPTHEHSAKGGSHHHHDHHHRSRWKNLLHTLHLDGANGLFYRFHGFHAQVAPHDSHRKVELQKDRSRKFDHEDGSSHGPGHKVHLNSEHSDAAQFDHKDQLHFSKDDGHHRDHPHSHDKDDHHRHHSHSHDKDDHHRHHPHFWKFGLKAVLARPFCNPGHLLSENEESDLEVESPAKAHAHHKHHHHIVADLKGALSSLKGSHRHHHHQQRRHEKHHDLHADGELQPGQPEPDVPHHEHHHHYHHHHHHVLPPEGGDYELTVQAISRRVPRKSFEDKARRLSLEDGGLKAPRNSLETRITPWEAEAQGHMYIEHSR